VGLRLRWKKMEIVGYALCVGDHLPLAAGLLALHRTTPHCLGANSLKYKEAK
jgi:hypothetical protein